MQVLNGAAVRMPISLPLLGALVLVGIPCRSQTVRKGSLFFNGLSTSDVGTYHGRVANDFRVPYPVNLRVCEVLE